ncbi:MAG: hypothetical protein ACKVZJ_08700 [Phycisphaerales bacterium]
MRSARNTRGRLSAFQLNACNNAPNRNDRDETGAPIVRRSAPRRLTRLDLNEMRRGAADRHARESQALCLAARSAREREAAVSRGARHDRPETSEADRPS